MYGLYILRRERKRQAEGDINYTDRDGVQENWAPAGKEEMKRQGIFSSLSTTIAHETWTMARFRKLSRDRAVTEENLEMGVSGT